jgi:hypothetical protein
MGHLEQSTIWEMDEAARRAYEGEARPILGIINDRALIKLAWRASSEGHEPLSDMLVMLAGMVDGEGRLDATPEVWRTWASITSLHGAYGRGFAKHVRMKNED